ncbi:MAG TPA: flagellar hook-associated protein FlgK [Azoarcus sp.]|nr:flagellar hook-associated protein FlgK [Azoarcus sp.]
MSGLLNIGLTGLNAAQAQLITTSHNISNAGVAGYHRQHVSQATTTPFYSGAGFLGQGTQIDAISRRYDQYLETQVLASGTRVAEYAAYDALIGQIDNLLGDQTSGLSPMMGQFFEGVQEVASNPTSVAARQALISAAESLAGRFQTLDARLSELRDGVEGQIGSAVEQINMYAGAIAEMNQRIAQVQVGGSSAAPNDLLDERDRLVSELNQLVRVSTVTENNGSLSVFIGSGQSLVVSGTAHQLGAVQDPQDPRRNAIALLDSRGVPNVLPEKLLSGGTLGGLLAFRRESLDIAQNSLGQIAIGMAESFNAQHARGIDLNGVLGTDFFRTPTVSVMPAGALEVSFDRDQIAALTSSDYEVLNDGGVFTLRRLSDGQSFGETEPGRFRVDGLDIDVSASTLAPGERALIQPTRFAARDISVSIADPRMVAAGNPVSVESPLSNLGDGRVRDIVIHHADGMPLNAEGQPDFGQLNLSFSGSGEYTLTLDGAPAGATVTLTPNTYSLATETQGKTFTATVTPDPSQPEQTYSFEFTLAGAPEPGDVFEFTPTEAGVADNRNAVALGALQTTRTMLAASAGDEPTSTFQSVYAQLVSRVGNKAREVQVNLASQEVLMTQATDARDSLSGVNLDEEAANLMRYQQAYLASAKVMSVAQSLFDEILSIAR